MKTLLYSLCIGLLLLACNKTDTATAVKPGAPLYQRWQAVDTGEYLTFKSLNYILYGPGGTPGTCCGPVFFTYHDNLIDFKHASPVPLPYAQKPAGCEAVRCPPLPDNWTVIGLTVNQLILMMPDGRHVYKQAN